MEDKHNEQKYTGESIDFTKEEIAEEFVSQVTGGIKCIAKHLPRATPSLGVHKPIAIRPTSVTTVNTPGNSTIRYTGDAGKLIVRIRTKPKTPKFGIIKYDVPNTR